MSFFSRACVVTSQQSRSPLAWGTPSDARDQTRGRGARRRRGINSPPRRCRCVALQLHVTPKQAAPMSTPITSVFSGVHDRGPNLKPPPRVTNTNSHVKFVSFFKLFIYYNFALVVVQPSGCDIKQTLKYTEKISMVPVQG